MATLEERVELRKTVQREYLLGLYSIATGHPVNMNDFADIKLEFESTPSKVDRFGNELWTVQVSKVSGTHEEFDINLQQYSIMTSLMKQVVGGEKQDRLEEMIDYLCRTYAHIKGLMDYNLPVFVEPMAVIDGGKKNPKMKHTYQVNIHYRADDGGPVRTQPFQVNEHHYLKILEMADMKKEFGQPHSANAPQDPYKLDPRFRIQCNPEIKQIPHMLPNKGLQGRSINPSPSTEVGTWAFECPCPRGYFCPIIMRIFADGMDILHWGPKIPRVRNNKSVLFCIAVPILDYFLFTVPVEASIRVDWNDNETSKFMAYGLTEEETLFYDDPRTQKDKMEFTMLRERIIDINRFIDDAVSTGLSANLVPSMGDKFISAACTSGKHTYGTNQKVMKFMDSRADSARIAIACFTLYGVCPICYINANPAFSLLPSSL